MKKKMKAPITKYDFKTGKIIGKVKKSGYQYKGKGEIGKLKWEIIDGIKNYYVNYRFTRSSFSKYKKHFKRVTYWEEDANWQTKWVAKKQGKQKLVFQSKITMPRISWGHTPEIKLGKDYISFYSLDESNIVTDLQLKTGDKLKITIEKLNKKTNKK